MEVKNVVLAGGGVLGSQIAFQSAFCGFNVNIWLRSEASIGRAKPKIEMVYQTYLKILNGLKGDGKVAANKYPGLISNPENVSDADIDTLIEKTEAAYKSINYVLDMEEAVKDADILIEAVAENPEHKIEFYNKLKAFLPEKTILVTNSSSLLPSMFAEHTGRPEKYLGFHFLNLIWEINIAEVMGHSKTSTESVKTMIKFAEDINMIPLEVKKEQPGYIFNSMLIPFLNSAMALWACGVAEPKTIDTTWVKATEANRGPFQILDIIGLNTPYNLVGMSPDAKDPNTKAGMIVGALKKMIDEGKTGLASGEGFYKYK